MVLRNHRQFLTELIVNITAILIMSIIAVRLNTLTVGCQVVAIRTIGKNSVFLFAPIWFLLLLRRIRFTRRDHPQPILHIRLLLAVPVVCIVVSIPKQPRTELLPAIRFGVKKITLTATKEAKQGLL